MKKIFAVIGLGRFGLGLVEELAKNGADVIAIDKNRESVELAGVFVQHSVICDSTNASALKELGIANADHVIVAIGGNIMATIMTTIILHELNIKKITVRVDDEIHIPVLLKIGAHETVTPEKLAGVRLANRVLSDTFVDYFNIGGEYNAVSILVNKAFVPITLEALNARNNFDVNITLIKRGTEFINPGRSDLIMPLDEILVIGTRTKISKFDKYINQE